MKPVSKNCLAVVVFIAFLTSLAPGVYAADPNGARQKLAEAQALFEAGHIWDALFFSQAAIKLNPNFAFAYAWRGRIHRRLGQYSPAITDYMECIRLAQQLHLSADESGSAFARDQLRILEHLALLYVYSIPSGARVILDNKDTHQKTPTYFEINIPGAKPARWVRVTGKLNGRAVSDAITVHPRERRSLWLSFQAGTPTGSSGSSGNGVGSHSSAPTNSAVWQRAGVLGNDRTSAITNLVFSQDDRYLASASEDGTLAIWNVEASNFGALPAAQPRGSHYTGALAFLRGSASLAIAVEPSHQKHRPDNSLIQLWNVEAVMSGRPAGPVWSFDGAAPAMNDLAASSDSSLFSSYMSGSMRRWDLRTEHSQEATRTIRCALGTLKVSPRGTWVGCVVGKDLAGVWRVGSLAADPIIVKQSGVSAISFENEHTLVTTSLSGTVEKWGLPPSARPETFPARFSSVRALAVAGTTGLVAIGTAKKQLFLHRFAATADGSGADSLLAADPARTQEITHIVFSPDSRWIACGLKNGSIELWHR